MTKQCLLSSRVVLVASLILSLSSSQLCGVARADDHSAGKSIRIPAAAFAPIGKVFSLGAISINGRMVRGEQTIWGGDVLQAFQEATAHVVIDSVGKVALTQGTTARLAVSTSILEDGTSNLALILSLICGAATVRLLEESSALIQAGGSAVTVTKGSAFRAEIRDGRAVIEALIGKVEIERGLPKRHYFVSVSDYDPLTSRETQIAISHTIKKKTRSKTNLLAKSTMQDIPSPRPEAMVVSVLRVSAPGRGPFESMQEKSLQPGDNRSLEFKLKTPGVGVLISGTQRGQSVTVVTDPQGIAPLVTFEAEPREGSTVITVTDVTEKRTPDEEADAWYATIKVEKGFWERHRTKIIAAGVAAVIAVIIRPRTKPLRQEPPPVIP
jgi:hypothetical protein